jgi:hypothetical protein
MSERETTAAERAAALAFARLIVPSITDAGLYEVHDRWGGYWQITVPLDDGGAIPYQFGRRL